MMSREKRTRPVTLILALGMLVAVGFMLQQGVNVAYWTQKVSMLAERFGLASQDGASVDAGPGVPVPVADQPDGMVVQQTVSLSEGPGSELSVSPVNSEQGATDVAPEPAPDPVRELNRRGVALVERGRYWEGIFLLEQAVQKEPRQILPLINMAVSLTAMGLDKPAARYLDMARQINPNHPWLLRNFAETSTSLTSPGSSREETELHYPPASEMPGGMNGMSRMTGNELTESAEGSGSELSDDLLKVARQQLWEDSLQMLWGVEL